MANAISKDNSRDFFKEVKNMQPKVKTPVSIDGYVNGNEIAQHFAGKYENLFVNKSFLNLLCIQ